MNIRELSLTFSSKSKAQEILYLLKDVKKVVRQGFYESELPPVEEFCKENNLTLAKSKFKVLMADDASFSNKGIKVAREDSRPGTYFIYVSKNERDAWLASYYELVDNVEDLGKLLGYPNCCIDFFIRRFSENNPNLQLKPTNMFTNLTKRHKDEVIISHFPCSSNCQESIKIGKKFFNVIFEFDRERARELIKELNV